MEEMLLEKESNITKVKTITNRFGTFEVDITNNIQFIDGLFGIHQCLHFCVLTAPQKYNQIFKIFQSVEDESLAYIILPNIKSSENKYIIYDQDDISEICKRTGVKEESLLILFIVTFEQIGEKNICYVNAKAPLLVNIDNMLGVQYLFENDKYSVKQQL